MERKEKYHTKQKDIILDIIKKENSRFRVDDIYKKTSGVGLTTVYRYINTLVDNGIIKKEIDNDNQVYYYYLSECTCINHVYLKCDKCGKIIHVDCDYIDKVYKHILEEHKFITNMKDLVISGRCQDCGR